MLPDRVSNPGPLTYESGALPIALRGPAHTFILTVLIPSDMIYNITAVLYLNLNVLYTNLIYIVILLHQH